MVECVILENFRGDITGCSENVERVRFHSSDVSSGDEINLRDKFQYEYDVWGDIRDVVRIIFLFFFTDITLYP